MVNQLPKVPAVFVMGKQVISSATSVNSNIVQARAGMSRPDFIKHMKIARKEVKETKRWIEMIVAAGLTSSNKTKLILEENEEIIKIIVTIAAMPIYQRSCYN
jgi:four helix bundle protein